MWRNMTQLKNMHYIRYTVKVNCYGKSESWAKLRPKIVNLEVEKKEEILLSPIVHLQQKLLYKAKWQHRNAAKSFDYITMRTELERSVGVTTTTKLVWLNPFLDPTFPLSAKLCHQTDTIFYHFTILLSSNGHTIFYHLMTIQSAR